ncbi:hypothetical protein C8R45DRAFT_1031932 [Mycena sanguinolenta]|nr:hypothetical protein C8R45DRAFT_1031932 [Mycena sanguinolenta]
MRVVSYVVSLPVLAFFISPLYFIFVSGTLVRTWPCDTKVRWSTCAFWRSVSVRATWPAHLGIGVRESVMELIRTLRRR